MFLLPGGMGDMAPTTTLAERLRRERDVGFYYRVGVRNQGVWDFWTRDNPYLGGLESSRPQTHWTRFGPEHDALLFKYKNNVMAHEAIVGLEPINTLPRIYWTPSYDRRWRGRVMVSAASVTVPFSREAFDKYVEVLVDRGVCRRDQMVFILPPDADKMSRFPEDACAGVERWRPDDVFQKANALHSCDLFICTESGDAAMGSAINARTGHPEILACSSTGTMNRLEFRWPNVLYFPLSGIREDWV